MEGGDTVVYRNELHMEVYGPDRYSECGSIPPTYSIDKQPRAIRLMRDRNNPGIIYMFSENEDLDTWDDTPSIVTNKPLDSAKRLRVDSSSLRSAPAASLRSASLRSAPDIETSKEERARLVALIVPIYQNGYEPPQWVGQNYIEEFGRYASKARLFVDSDADLQLARSVACEREPVNIGAHRHYNRSELRKHFGYETSLYERHYDNTGTLAPNIGVLTVCKVDVSGTEKEAMIYHAIGAALDSPDQPDYKVFVARGLDIRGLIQFYVSVFEKIFIAAAMWKADGVVMSLVGGGAFADLYPPYHGGGRPKMHTEVWVPAFKFVWERYRYKTKLAAMGDLDNPAGAYLLSQGASNAGFYPGLVPKYPNWLIVNAWDCHTLPGNGNRNDPTLDGYIGRASAIHYFGWGVTNPLLIKNTVQVDVPKHP
jgi:hypothetical protein